MFCNGTEEAARATVSGWALIVSVGGHPHIEGEVRNHPRLPDGPVHATRIVSFEKAEGRTIAVTLNTRYELLEPAPVFNSLHPGFKDLMFPGPVPGYFGAVLAAID